MTLAAGRSPAAVAATALTLLAALLGAVAAAAGPAGAAVASSTSLTVQGSAGPVLVGYGQPVVAAAQVSVPGAVPDGWVYVVVDGVSRRTDVAADGTASTTVEGLATGTHQVWAAFVPRDPAQQDGSTSAATTVTVEQVLPAARLRVTGRRVDRVTGLHVRLRTPYGTEPTGKVIVSLKRLGTPGKRNRNLALEDGRASLAVGRLAAGSYRAQVRYSGDRNTVALTAAREFRVRR